MTKQITADDLVSYSNQEGHFVLSMEQLIAWGKAMYEAGQQAGAATATEKLKGLEWSGKRKLPTEEAAKYLGITKATLYEFQKRYKMVFEKGRPNYFTLEELDRVERERRVRLH